MFASVLLCCQPYTSLTYRIPKHLADLPWSAGFRVLVPLGSRFCMGLVASLHKEIDLPENIQIKELLWPLDLFPLLPQSHMALIKDMAIRQGNLEGRIASALLPATLRTGSWRLRALLPNSKPKNYSPRTLFALSQEQTKENFPDENTSNNKEKSELTQIAQAFLSGQATWQASQGKGQELCILQVEPPWPVRPGAVKQRAILDKLFAEGALSRKMLNHSLNFDLAQSSDKSSVDTIGPPLMKLVEQGLVRLSLPAEMDETWQQHEALLPPAPPSWTLSEEQERVIAECEERLEADLPSTVLVHGVTGSGKTVVYLELIERALRLGKSVLLLAPEVALAIKLFRDVRECLPKLSLESSSVFLYHGYQSAKLRERLFFETQSRDRPCIVVGTRSALFLPLRHLGLVVLDEEHDASFKQDEGLAYQAKEIAWFLVKEAKALLLLGSATPDIKTFFAAKEERIPLLSMPKRVGGASLPSVELVKLEDHNLHDNMLSPPSLAALQETIKKGEQAVMLLNRRGYAPSMYCLSCGKTKRCPHCDIALTYHKALERMLCHFCGYAVHFPCLCPHCQASNFLPMGQGTERLHEQIASVLPAGSGVLRLDKDSTRRPGNMEAVLQSFAGKEAQVLVGTQMLSKGHHFPDVTLVIVVDGDMGLNVPDYRAAERTFQLLVQTAGRAGRSSKEGRVLIQTRDSRHYCWAFIKDADYHGFYEHELALRKLRLYPPFICLALIRFSWALEWKEGNKHIEQVGKLLREKAREYDVRALGPAPSPHSFLRGRIRWQALLKGSNWPAIRAVFLAIQKEIDAKCRVSLDIDPVSMV